MALYHIALGLMTTTQFSSEACSQYKAKAYAAASAKSPLAPVTIDSLFPYLKDHLDLCHTSIYEQFNTCNIATVILCQKLDGFGDLIRLPILPIGTAPTRLAFICLTSSSV
jgi:hypothetical protein